MNIICEVSEYEYLHKLSGEHFNAFPAKLSLGHLFISPEYSERKSYLKLMIDESFDDKEYLEEFETTWSLLKKSMKELGEISPEEDVFIWLNSSPDSICMLYYLVNFFNKKNNKLFIIHLPTFQVSKGKTKSFKIKHCYYWDDYELSKDSYITTKKELAMQLSPIQKKLYLEKWGNIMAENKPIRVLLNGRLIGVGENFYDSVILFQLNGQAKKISRLISDIHFLHLFIPQWWIEGRIKYLIEINIIKVIDAHNNFYNRVVKIRE